MSERACVCGAGMATAVGDGAGQTVSSFEAGLSRYRESRVFNRRGQPMVLALLPDRALPPARPAPPESPVWTPRQARMLRLASRAFRDLHAERLAGAGVPLYLAGPAPIPGRAPAITDSFLDHLRAQDGIAFDRARSRVFANGQAAGLSALRAALDFLARGEGDLVLVGGVDSYFDLHLLGTLDLEGRVLADGVADGFAPGEGAAFLLLSMGATSAGAESEPLARVHPPGLATEPGHRGSEQPYRGDGLATAIREALQAHGDGKVRTVFSNLNGESLGAKEWGVSVARNHSAFDPAFRFEHPADCLGETGAAAGPILLGLAALGLHRGTVEGPCLVWCSSDGPERGAVRLSRWSAAEN